MPVILKAKAFQASWAGYIIAKNPANPQLEVIAINASGIVPKINTSAGDGYSSAWIGIGGQSSKTLIQVGTEHDVVNGQLSDVAGAVLSARVEC